MEIWRLLFSGLNIYSYGLACRKTKKYWCSSQSVGLGVVALIPRRELSVWLTGMAVWDEEEVLDCGDVYEGQMVDLM